MGKWGVSIQMPPHKIRHLIPALMTGARTRKGQFQRCIRGLCGGKHRIRAGLSTGGEKTSRVIQVLLSSASTTMRFTSALDISREKPQFACHCFSIVRRRFSTRRMRSARVCSAFCKDRQLRTDQRSVRHVPDFHHAVCRFCLHPADRFYFVSHFFCTPFLLTGSDLPRGLKKQDFRSFLLCNYGIMNAQTERQCYLA